MTPQPLPQHDRLPIARYRFTARLTQRLSLEWYAGSQLRGVFGRALRQISCITRAQQCEGCPLIPSCPYPQFFQPPAPADHPLQRFSEIPTPYLIEPPAIGLRWIEAGEPLVFQMVLIGDRAIRQLALVVYAWQQALRQGITRERVCGELLEVAYCPPEGVPEPIYRLQPHTHPVIAPHRVEPIPRPVGLEAGCHLRLLTPLRLKSFGTLEGNLNSRLILNSLVRRYRLLVDFYGDAPPVEEPHSLTQQTEAIECQTDLHYHDWLRYSSRQQQTMNLGGWMGTVTLRGDLSPFLMPLAEGEWFHLGGKTSFGLGRYRLEPLEDE